MRRWSPGPRSEAPASKSVMLLVSMLPLVLDATAAGGTTSFVIASMTDLLPGGATSVTTAGCPPGEVSLRSGGHHSTTQVKVRFFYSGASRYLPINP